MLRGGEKLAAEAASSVVVIIGWTRWEDFVQTCDTSQVPIRPDTSRQPRSHDSKNEKIAGGPFPPDVRASSIRLHDSTNKSYL